jgi:hypothetical protein
MLLIQHNIKVLEVGIKMCNDYGSENKIKCLQHIMSYFKFYCTVILLYLNHIVVCLGVYTVGLLYIFLNAIIGNYWHCVFKQSENKYFLL